MVLYTSFKYGGFEEKRNGRYFTDLTEIKLKALVESIPGLEIVEVDVTADVRVGQVNEKWLNGVLKKVVFNKNKL